MNELKNFMHDKIKEGIEKCQTRPYLPILIIYSQLLNELMSKLAKNRKQPKYESYFVFTYERFYHLPKIVKIFFNRILMHSLEIILDFPQFAIIKMNIACYFSTDFQTYEKFDYF